MEWTEITKKCKKQKKEDKKWFKEDEKAREFKKVNGFYAQECWNLDASIALFVLPRLAFLSANHTGSPFFPNSLEEANNTELQEKAAANWNEALEKMVKGFYLYCFKDEYTWTENEKNLWAETKKLFCENFESLWD